MRVALESKSDDKRKKINTNPNAHAGKKVCKPAHPHTPVHSFKKEKTRKKRNNRLVVVKKNRETGRHEREKENESTTNRQPPTNYQRQQRRQMTPSNQRRGDCSLLWSHHLFRTSRVFSGASFVPPMAVEKLSCLSMVLPSGRRVALIAP